MLVIRRCLGPRVIIDLLAVPFTQRRVRHPIHRPTRRNLISLCLCPSTNIVQVFLPHVVEVVGVRSLDRVLLPVVLGRDRRRALVAHATGLLRSHARRRLGNSLAFFAAGQGAERLVAELRSS